MEQSILKMSGITKEFPGVKALDSVNLEIKKGEIHGLCGENGAGKSTLMKILSGVYPYGTYEGDIFINNELHQFQGIRQSENAGIAIIYQEFTLVKEMDVSENIFLGREPVKNGVLDRNRMNHESQKLLEELGLDINLHTKIKHLGIGQQQLVEIAKALSHNAKILILDEPSAALTETETDLLLNILKLLKEKGITCIYISHKLSEVLRISDRVTVLRDGKSVSTNDTSNLTEDSIIRLMVGREMKERFPKENFKAGETVFEVKNFTVFDQKNNKSIIRDANFSVRKGEVLGISGLMGAGRTELVMSIFGAMDWEKKGTLLLDNKEIQITSPSDAIKLGIGLVTEDRKRYGLILQQSVQKNISLAALDDFCTMSVINANKEISACTEKISELKIKTPSLEARADNLSGGNQQKVILARWLLSRTKVLFLDEPTRGIDVGAKYEIYNIINQLVRQGVAVVVISSELPEILGMCDRILVMHNGTITGEFENKEATQEKIMACAIGGK